MHTPTYMRPALAAATLVVALLAPTAARADTPGQILRDLAANQTHSWTDNSIGYRAMVDRYKAGERLNVTCGYVSEVARRLLVEAGYTARVVQVITRDEFDGLNDGHAMVEVFADRRWRLYDVDANARAVDTAGQGVSLVEQIEAVKQDRAYWEPLADDPLFREDEPDEFLREAIRKVFADPAAFYKRIMGTAFLPRDPEGTGNGGLYYVDADQTNRLRENGLLAGRYLADAATWFNLTGVELAELAVETKPATAATLEIVEPPAPAAAPPALPAVTNTTAAPTVLNARTASRHRNAHRTTKRACRKHRRCARWASPASLRPGRGSPYMPVRET